MLRIGTRESQLAVWQATLVKNLLALHDYDAELVYIKSEGDIDLKTPLYEMGVQGIFTRSLDIALLNNRIDIAVHSMKDVPTQLPKGTVQAAVLKRASYKDLLVYKGGQAEVEDALGIVNGEWSKLNSEFSVVSDNDGISLTTHNAQLTIATSSIRRKAQWLNRYPGHTLENLRGNVNSRLRKLENSDWNGAIFAAAGLERIDLRPEKSIELDWMLPAPAQGAIMVVCKEGDNFSLEACNYFNDAATALCTKLEKDFLRELMGGCSTPVSALAEIKDDELTFKGNIFSVDGKHRVDVEKHVAITDAEHTGTEAAWELLSNGGQAIADKIHYERE